MKKKRGRKEGTGVYSGIKPSSQTWSDIRNTIIYGSAEWRIIVLQELASDWTSCIPAGMDGLFELV